MPKSYILLILCPPLGLILALIGGLEDGSILS